MTDREIKRRVERALELEPVVDTTTIGVTVCRGVVTLHGEVVTPEQRWTAERTAQRVPDVRAVADDIELTIVRPVPRTDASLARAVANTLASHAGVPAGTIDVSVRDGWVSLSGTVIRPEQKLAVERTVRLLYGVQGVFSAIAVAEPPSKGGEHDESHSIRSIP